MQRAIVVSLMTMASCAAAAQTAPNSPTAPSSPPPYASSSASERPGFPTIIGGNGASGSYGRPGANSLQRPSPYGFGPADVFFASSRRYQDNYQQIQQYGRCAVSVNTQRARNVLTTVPNTRTELVELRQLGGTARGCLPFGFGAPVVFVRGGLAEAMYRRLPAGTLVRPQAVTAANVAAFSAASRRFNSSRLVDDRRYSQLADCLVLQAPQPVDQALRSRHGSDQELQAFNAMLAQSPGCSNQTTFPTAGGRPFLRSYLAESAYRWARFQPLGRAPLG